MKVVDFCNQSLANGLGRQWLESTGMETIEEVWSSMIPTEWRLWLADRPGVMNDRDRRVFACWCVRQSWDKILDDCSKQAVGVSERYANGNATHEELRRSVHDASCAADNRCRHAYWKRPYDSGSESFAHAALAVVAAAKDPVSLSVAAHYSASAQGDYNDARKQQAENVLGIMANPTEKGV
jgi:hypothetical protein